MVLEMGKVALERLILLSTTAMTSLFMMVPTVPSMVVDPLVASVSVSVGSGRHARRPLELVLPTRPLPREQLSHRSAGEEMEEVQCTWMAAVPTSAMLN